MRVEAQSILYVESLKDYVKIYTPTEAILTKYKISEMEDELGRDNFVRIRASSPGARCLRQGERYDKGFLIHRPIPRDCVSGDTPRRLAKT